MGWRIYLASSWRNDDLATAVARRHLWPTPRASEWKGTGPLGSRSHQHRLERGYLDATVQEAEQVTGQLNPPWVEWLMGYPPGWTDLGPSATPSSPKSPSSSGGNSGPSSRPRR